MTVSNSHIGWLELIDPRAADARLLSEVRPVASRNLFRVAKSSSEQTGQSATSSAKSVSDAAPINGGRIT